MSPRSVSELALREPPVLKVDEPVESAVRRVLEAQLPALPVVDARERFAGIFGEREFMAALYPGYVQQLRTSRFLSRSLDEALEKRQTCRIEPVGDYMNTDHVDVGTDYSDTQVAEIFLHHRVLVVPVLEDGRVRGLITRSDFFRAIAERFLERG
jgi:CBS domain-containing protein